MSTKPNKKSVSKESYINRLVRHHNENPGPVTKFLRQNYTYMSAAIVAGAFALHAADLPIGRKLLFLSYEEKGDNVVYGYGSDDFYVIFFWAAAFTLLRGIIDFPLLKLANYLGVSDEEKPKFSDMGWQGMYYTTAWFTGMSLYRNAEWGYCPQAGWWSGLFGGILCGYDGVWNGFPHDTLPAALKWYYLLQIGFWFHQLFLMSVEHWRKDFWMFYLHHFITIGMLVGSYFIGGTRIGTTLLVEQDFADIFLPAAKMLNYADIEPFSTIMYAMFAIAWIPTRHGIYFYILGTVIGVDVKAIGLSERTKFFFVAAMVAFQCLLLLWLKQLLISVHKAITNKDGITSKNKDIREIVKEKSN